MADQTDLLGAGSVDGLGGQDQFHGVGHTHDAGQTLSAAEAGGDAQANLGLTKHGSIGAQTDVTAHSQFAAAAQGKTAHSGDGGNGQSLQLTEHIVTQFAESHAFSLGQAAHLADVSAGDKGFLTLAGDHQAANGIQIDAVQRLVQFTNDLIVQRIQRSRTVDGEHAHIAFRGEFDILHIEDLLIGKTGSYRAQVSLAPNNLSSLYRPVASLSNNKRWVMKVFLLFL